MDGTTSWISPSITAAGKKGNAGQTCSRKPTYWLKNFQITINSVGRGSACFGLPGLLPSVATGAPGACGKRFLIGGGNFVIVLPQLGFEFS